MTYYTRYDSPIGQLLLTSDGTALTRLCMEPHPPTDGWIEDAEPLRPAIDQLNEYFAGNRRSFDLPLAQAGTPFQTTVWLALQAIPYGTTISYAELARRIGNPKACRAVGLANGQNRIGLIVPCHRVIGADGSLTGYGGGIDRKRFLLKHEGIEA